VLDERFSTRQVVGQSMLSLDGSDHGRHRDPFARAYRLDAVRAGFTSFVAAETDRLIDAIEPDGQAELRRSVAGPLAVAVVAHALGLGEVDAAEVLGWYDAFVDAVNRVAAGGEVTLAAREAFARLRSTIAPSVVGDVGDLTADEVVSNAAVILFGGIETTEGMIANAILHLLSHRSELALVEADRGLLANAVEESLRLEPAAAWIDRYSTRAVELAGAAIGERELMSVSIAGANRDPATFPEPDRFDVRRENARLHVAFAHGPHVCIGMHLARLEAHTALQRVLDRLPRLRLDPERPSAPRGLVFRKPPSLHVLWGQRA
jgi:cytochrome P450